MSSVGEILRHEREKQCRSIADIASLTRIKPHLVHAIETDDWKSLNGVFFYRSFVAQYASALGVDFHALEQQLDQLTPRREEKDPLPALRAAYQPAAARRRPDPAPKAGLSFALLIAVLFGCSGVYALWQQSEQRAEPGSEASESPVAAPANEPLPAEPARPVVDSPAPAEAPPPAPSASENGPIRVDLSARETTWVSVSSAGRTVFSGVLAPSETRNIEVTDSARLTTGNAAGLDLHLNGKPVGPIGARGQVRTVLFTASRFEIVGQHKM